ncbi:hypothetical protein B0H17DRAFT_1147918 [Mycena rosella]|uniref:Uncharacterized protein n=1 Tax=Mycena rosella TaxID=1033263 RepID=A0AAD7CHC3_MYCRO|nr:hypothetical protein B0H17DRAFT_1147918 [Mycena rosella]
MSEFEIEGGNGTSNVIPYHLSTGSEVRIKIYDTCSVGRRAPNTVSFLPYDCPRSFSATTPSFNDFLGSFCSHDAGLQFLRAYSMHSLHTLLLWPRGARHLKKRTGLGFAFSPRAGELTNYLQCRPCSIAREEPAEEAQHSQVHPTIATCKLTQNRWHYIPISRQASFDKWDSRLPHWDSDIDLTMEKPRQCPRNTENIGNIIWDFIGLVAGLNAGLPLAMARIHRDFDLEWLTPAMFTSCDPSTLWVWNLAKIFEIGNTPACGWSRRGALVAEDLRFRRFCCYHTHLFFPVPLYSLYVSFLSEEVASLRLRNSIDGVAGYLVFALVGDAGEKKFTGPPTLHGRGSLHFTRWPQKGQLFDALKIRTLLACETYGITLSYKTGHISENLYHNLKRNSNAKHRVLTGEDQKIERYNDKLLKCLDKRELTEETRPEKPQKIERELEKNQWAEERARKAFEKQQEERESLRKGSGRVAMIEYNIN